MATTSRLVALAVLASVVATGCGASSAPEPGAAPGGQATVYKVTLGLPGLPGSRRIEWFDPRTGAWRIDEGDETRIFTGRTYAVTDEYGTRIRTGSPLFLRGRGRLPVADEALAAYRSGNTAARAVTVTRRGGKTELRFVFRSRRVAAVVESTAVDPGRLFAVPADDVVATERERPAGAAPTLDVEGYWLGPEARGRTAAMAVEYQNTVTPELMALGGFSELDNVTAYIVFYELPSVGRLSSAVPGQSAPPGELQVVSQPLDSPAAQQDLAAFGGRLAELRGPVWPRFEVTLAGGERATVYYSPENLPAYVDRFAVATAETLVNVTGRVRVDAVRALASQLAPINR